MGKGWWSGLGTDLRRSVGYLLSRPLVTLVTVVTAGLGIGAAGVLFSFSLELKGDRYYQGPRDGRAFYLYGGERDRPSARMPIGDFEAYREGLKELGDIYAWRAFQGVAGLDGDVLERDGLERDGGVTAHFIGQGVLGGHFECFNAPTMAHGRPLTVEDDRPGSEPTVVLSHAFWQRRFAADPEIVGRTLRLDGRPFTVVGVTPPNFLGQGISFHLFIPLAHLRSFGARSTADDHSWTDVFAFVHLKPDVSPGDATRQAVLVAAELDRTVPRPDGTARQVKLSDPLYNSNAGFDDSERLLAAVVFLLLTLAVVNIGHLQWASSASRSHQWTVLRALGASRFHVARRLGCESLLWALPAGALALLLTRTVNDRLADQLQITPTGLGAWGADMDYMPVDGSVVTFVVVLTLVVALGTGCLPWILRRRLSLADGLRGRGLTVSRAGQRARQSLVVLQVALSTALLVSAALLSHSLINLLAVDPGFQSDRLAVAAVRAVPDPQAPASRAVLQEAARAAVASLPGVDAATLASEVPGTGNSPRVRFQVPGFDEARVVRTVVGNDFFTTLDIAIETGRDFHQSELAPRTASEPRLADGPPQALRPVIVNRAFVERRLEAGAGDDAVGRTFRLREVYPDAVDAEVRIVGVAQDTLHQGRRPEPEPLVYLPLGDMTGTGVSVVARTATDPRLQLRPMVERLSTLDPKLALVEVDLHRRHVEFDLYLEVILEGLTRLFGLAALILAVSGIYAVLSLSVQARRREMGIRLAVGAAPGDVLRSVLVRSLGLISVGVMAGLAASWWLGRWIESLLYGVGRADPVTWSLVAVVSILAGVAATWGPARRASRTDPLIVLGG